MIDVNVDDGARIDVEDLKTKLQGCLANKRAVYAVVAIIGSTEHGACDPLDKIISLRDSTDVSSSSVAKHILFSS
jgi:glutamate/tyrosine decarboxylase-like PLP-dependent enzyme